MMDGGLLFREGWDIVQATCLLFYSMLNQCILQTLLCNKINNSIFCSEKHWMTVSMSLSPLKVQCKTDAKPSQ